MFNTIPAFNLKAVLSETGIAADTLRAWERRYGLPMPERTPGGHRLYSQHDIEIVKWLMARQEEGLSISHAVDLWNELTGAGQDPLAASVKPAIVSISAANLDVVRSQWLDACLAFNETLAEQILNQAFVLYPVEMVCTQVIQRGLHEIGEWWYGNRVTVQQEHFTFALAQRRLNALITVTPPPIRPESILIGCAPNEQHSFAPLLLTLLLRRRGLRVVYLGANVPAMEFEKAVYKIEPTLIILSAQQLHTADDLRNAVDYMQRTGKPITYGGRIFNLLPELRQQIPAYFLGETLEQALENAQKLLSTKTLAPFDTHTLVRQTVPERDFKNNRPMLEFYLTNELLKHDLPFQHMEIATKSTGDNIESALAFGNLDFVSIEADWISGLMEQHGQDPALLKIFWEAYATAADKSMGATGKIVAAWLRQKAEQFT